MATGRFVRGRHRATTHGCPGHLSCFRYVACSHETRPEIDRTRLAFYRLSAGADADLAGELGEPTRTANRANATLYTIDPRGLIAGPDLDQQLDPVEFGEHVRKTQDSLRVLADLTGGIAVVNQNDFDKALKRIDVVWPAGCGN